ncbi:PREDICTED: espin-like protein [Ficedula albicollis]|uniref:espin-like protein n=1 Tax=Ficedula albicollis TaxID=59894 RepID=UPI0007AD8BC4|nr:PREDICTED: espin-like protein [Ficedula albicollis]
MPVTDAQTVVQQNPLLNIPHCQNLSSVPCARCPQHLAWGHDQPQPFSIVPKSRTRLGAKSPSHYLQERRQFHPLSPGHDSTRPPPFSSQLSPLQQDSDPPEAVPRGGFSSPRRMEPGRSVPAELKLRKPSQRARIPAPFLAHADGAPGPAGPPGPDPAEVDAESLVPTHDERGRLIPEWKRQVMVRRLRARLASEDPAGGQDAASWSFSASHQAVLGPFGELLTEADLHQLERAVESLRLRRRGEVYQGELRRLPPGGGPAEYDSLSLELFMLGYFRILEQDLPPEERRGRHLLCFEVFEQLGRHGWRAVRAFHRAVIDEIAAGRRGWRDGFDDIKARFFGTLHSPARRPGQPAEEGDEICRYIDRSFAFWKEKEAEIFSLEE